MLYADHNATSSLHSAAADKMMPFLREEFGNPSSIFHLLGARAREAVEEARAEVAALVGAQSSEVVFVSGGTESCAHAIYGGAKAKSAQCRVIHSSVEHSAVLEAVRFLQEFRGCRSTELPVCSQGLLDEELLKKELRASREAIVSVMAANNETGIRFPLARIAEAVRREGGGDSIFHTDAVQLVGKGRIEFTALPIDLLSISAHKFGGPKGIGALVVREGCAWQPVIKGGGQEHGMRGGTEAVAMIVGMGEAARIRREQLVADSWGRVRQLRDRFEQLLQQQISDVRVIGGEQDRLANTSSLIIEGVNGKRLRADLAQRGIVVATGSACSASQVEPSHVLRAMGYSVFDCVSAIRASFGITTTEQEVEMLAAVMAEEVKSQRQSALEVLDQRLVANT